MTEFWTPHSTPDHQRAPYGMIEHMRAHKPVSYGQQFDLTPNLRHIVSGNTAAQEWGRARPIRVLGMKMGGLGIGHAEYPTSEHLVQLFLGIGFRRMPNADVRHVLSDSTVIVGAKHERDPGWDIYVGRLEQIEETPNWRAGGFNRALSPAGRLEDFKDAVPRASATPVLVGRHSKVHAYFHSEEFERLSLF